MIRVLSAALAAGLCELALRKYRDAAEHLAESLQQRAALSLNLQRRFEDGQRSAEARVVRFYLGVSPADAEVLLDGKPVGKQAASYELFLAPGQHTVRARLLGYGDAVNTFTADAGDKRAVPTPPGDAPMRAVTIFTPGHPLSGAGMVPAEWRATS